MGGECGDENRMDLCRSHACYTGDTRQEVERDLERLDWGEKSK